MGKDTTSKARQFDDTKAYWVKGETLNALWEAIRKSKPLAGRNTSVRETPDGRVVDSTGGPGVGRHPWELYFGSEGWRVHPATVNYEHTPTMGGVSLDDEEPPEVSAGFDGELDAWLTFKLDAEAKEGFGGVCRLVSGSEIVSDVEVVFTEGTTTPVAVGAESCEVTPGTYYILIGSVRGNVKVAQYMRWSVYFSVCTGGGITPLAYG